MFVPSVCMGSLPFLFSSPLPPWLLKRIHHYAHDFSLTGVAFISNLVQTTDSARALFKIVRNENRTQQKKTN